MLKSTKAALRNKYVLTSVVFVLLIAGVLGLRFVLAATGPLNIGGDAPIVGTDLNIWFYDGDQSGGNPCGGNAVTGTSLLDSDVVDASSSNNNYDDDKEWEINVSSWTSGNTGYLYVCDGTSTSNERIAYSRQFEVGDYVMDISRVDGNNLVTSELNGKHVVVCEDLGGPKLSTQLSSISGNTYTQYYLKDMSSGGNIDDSDAFIQISDSDTCTFDSSTSAARSVDLLSGESYNDYGVSVAFHPDTLINGDMHQDLSDALLYFNSQSTGQSVGIAKVVSSADGQDTANDDFSTYIDKSVINTGDIQVIIDPTSTENLTVENIDKSSFNSLDALQEITGTNYEDLDEVRALVSTGTDTQKWFTSPYGRYFFNIYKN
jgi:hypothetical protein